MSQNVSEFVWKRLSEWGLSRVYGYPGDGVGGLDVALEKAKEFMHYVQVRHEEMAAFMASAHAKFTGQVGLCYATSGPGAIHLLTGLFMGVRRLGVPDGGRRQPGPDDPDHRHADGRADRHPRQARRTLMTGTPRKTTS
jgi:hypothetical protein